MDVKDVARRVRECAEIRRTLEALGAVPAALSPPCKRTLVRAMNEFVHQGTDAQVVVRFEQPGRSGACTRGRFTGSATVTLRAASSRQSGVSM